MLSCRRSLLLLCALTLHRCLSADPDVQEEKSIRDVIRLYNQREGGTYLYKVLDLLPPAPDEEEETPKRREFIIRETVCPKSDNPDPSQCDYKPDGDVKICSVDLSAEDPEDVTCSGMTQRPRVRRAGRRKCKGILCKLGSFSIIGSVVRVPKRG